MKILREIFGQLVMEYGKQFAVEAIQDILFHDVESGRMTAEESERIFASLGK